MEIQQHRGASKSGDEIRKKILKTIRSFAERAQLLLLFKVLEPFFSGLAHIYISVRIRDRLE